MSHTTCIFVNTSSIISHRKNICSWSGLMYWPSQPALFRFNSLCLLLVLTLVEVDFLCFKMLWVIHFSYISMAVATNQEKFVRRHDILHNDTKHNDTQHSVTKHSNTQHWHSVENFCLESYSYAKCHWIYLCWVSLSVMYWVSLF